MAVYKPALSLSNSDREVLVLIGQLILAQDGSKSPNISSESVPLSPAEAARLLLLLEQFVSSKLFIEGAYFAEGIANNDSEAQARLREIYLSWRSRRGLSRVASGYVWHEFLHRAGFDSGGHGWYVNSDARRWPVRPMSLEHFLGMEKKLLNYAKLHPRVAELLICFVENTLPSLEQLRHGDVKLPRGAVTKFVRQTVSDVSKHVDGTESEPMSRNKLIALSVIILDVSAMFTTRDWTAASVISSIAGVLPDSFGK